MNFPTKTGMVTLEVMKLTISKKQLLNTFSLLLLSLITFLAGFSLSSYLSKSSYHDLLSPFVDPGLMIEKPLQSYSIPELQKRNYQATKLVLERKLAETDNYVSYLFSYISENKKMTGQLNLPKQITANPKQEKKVIVMLRGYVPKEVYQTGMGTKNAAATFANNGYITVAPDFFGYGESDPEPEDSWQTRFEKPINVIELIKSIEEYGIPLKLEDQVSKSQLATAKISKLGIWAHSNGGQIALTTLEILRRPIPTTLWAPVTAPFPYSILYFSDELADEGKAQRKWLAMFEEKYDVFDFSLTQHLDSLTGPIQIQHGESDDAALIYWSREFIDKIEAENKKREQVNLDSTQSAYPLNSKPLAKIEIKLITYPNTNHNMVPNWSKAIQKDLLFFKKFL